MGGIHLAIMGTGGLAFVERFFTCDILLLELVI
jgi:hypothetical protein